MHAAMPVRFTGTTPYAVEEHANVSRVNVLGERVWMVYRRDEAEWRRRTNHGLGALTELDLLDVLMDLPAHMPVPLGSLAAHKRRTLARLPAGVIRHGAGTVTRLIIPAVSPLLAIVPAREWQSGAESASGFAAYCPRMVVLREMPPDKEMTLSQASWYGIGVALAGEHAPRILIDPEPLADWQPTPAWWAFSEKIYAQVSSAETDHR